MSPLLDSAPSIPSETKRTRSGKRQSIKGKGKGKGKSKKSKTSDESDESCGICNKTCKDEDLKFVQNTLSERCMPQQCILETSFLILMKVQ
jgi:hypothetical protein